MTRTNLLLCTVQVKLLKLGCANLLLPTAKFVRFVNLKTNFQQKLMWAILLWILCAGLVGIAGLDRKGGFWRAFLIGLILSPLVSLILVTGSAARNPRGCNHCGNHENEAEYCGLCHLNSEGLTREDIAHQSL
jgi:hypothetical protein